MLPFESLFCPCCTGAMLHTLAQTSAGLIKPHLFLELGKGALITAIGVVVQPSTSLISNQAHKDT
jgi:hypothetical protein